MTTIDTAIPGVERESWVRRKAHESMLFATVERVLRNPVGLFAVAGIGLILVGVWVISTGEHDTRARVAGGSPP